MELFFQMHQLIEVIKREQNIYNIIFHELIRQVSVSALSHLVQCVAALCGDFEIMPCFKKEYIMWVS